MKFKSVVAAVLLAIAGLAGATITQDLTPVATVDGWDIYKDDGDLVCVL